MTKLETVNAVLATFSDISIEQNKGFYVCWTNYKGEKIKRKWQAQSGSHYPTWHRKLPYGGNTFLALHQLIVWLRDGYVFPLSVWEYWTSRQIKLGNSLTLQILKDGGWPERATCMKCSKLIEGRFDWFSVQGKEGCGHWDDCLISENTISKEEKCS